MRHIRLIEVSTKRITIAIAVLLLIGTAPIALADPATPSDDQPNRIRIDYGQPKTPQNLAIYKLLKEHRALERFQEIFSPFRLPIDLTLRLKDCEGVSNSWYERPIVTICYEYVDDIRKNLPTDNKPEDPVFVGISSRDAMFGQFFYVVAHEMGHAMFDLLDVPLFGRSEDAADGFATYMMLDLGKDEAQRLILGAAYSYREYVKNPRVCVPLLAFSDAHAAPMQRFYNLLCIGYGANPALFSDFVKKGFLPQNRADSCRVEYNEVNYAFHEVIAPHLDPTLAKMVLDKTCFRLRHLLHQPPFHCGILHIRPTSTSTCAPISVCRSAIATKRTMAAIDPPISVLAALSSEFRPDRTLQSV